MADKIVEPNEVWITVKFQIVLKYIYLYYIYNIYIHALKLRTGEEESNSRNDPGV